MSKLFCCFFKEEQEHPTLPRTRPITPQTKRVVLDSLKASVQEEQSRIAHEKEEQRNVKR